jgi:hypothetical protein
MNHGQATLLLVEVGVLAVVALLSLLLGLRRP